MSKPAPELTPSPAMVGCVGPECVSVTKEFVKEHGRLFAEKIRLKAALKLCQEKP